MHYGRGEQPRASLAVHDWSVFDAALKSGDIGFAESYIAGDWTTPNLTDLLRVFIANRQQVEGVIYGSWAGRLLYRIKHLLNRNTRANNTQTITNITTVAKLGLKWKLDTEATKAESQTLSFLASIFPSEIEYRSDGVVAAEAVNEAMRVVSEVNKYLSDTAPWKLKTEDPGRMATVLHVALQLIHAWVRVTPRMRERHRIQRVSQVADVGKLQQARAGGQQQAVDERQIARFDTGATAGRERPREPRDDEPAEHQRQRRQTGSEDDPQNAPERVERVEHQRSRRPIRAPSSWGLNGLTM